MTHAARWYLIASLDGGYRSAMPQTWSGKGTDASTAISTALDIPYYVTNPAGHSARADYQLMGIGKGDSQIHVIKSLKYLS
jgi:hypothetical protein